MIFSSFQKNLFLGYSWSTLLWYRCYYPHRSRDPLSPVCGIFCWLFVGSQWIIRWSFVQMNYRNECCDGQSDSFWKKEGGTNFLAQTLKPQTNFKLSGLRTLKSPSSLKALAPFTSSNWACFPMIEEEPHIEQKSGNSWEHSRQLHHGHHQQRSPQYTGNGIRGNRECHRLISNTGVM